MVEHEELVYLAGSLKLEVIEYFRHIYGLKGYAHLVMMMMIKMMMVIPQDDFELSVEEEALLMMLLQFRHTDIDTT